MPEIRIKGPNANLYHKQKWWLGFADKTVQVTPWALGAVALAVFGSALELEPEHAQVAVNSGLAATVVLAGAFFWAKWYAGKFK